MKKSKIIIPALGMLLVSTGASISGTVAWFTANRSFEMEASTFGITKLDGNLDCTLATGIGTSAVDNVATPHTVTVNGLMTDASVNSSGQIWTNDGDVQDKFYQITTLAAATSGNLLAGQTSTPENVWWAVTWTMTFKYTYSGSTTTQDLFFNPKTSTITGTQRVTGDSNETHKAFRIGFFVGGTNKIIWANKQTSANCLSVTSTTGTAATGNLLASNTSGYNNTDAYAAAIDGGANTTRPDYLGTIPYSATPAECILAVTAVAWFEGTDPTVVNTARLDDVTASLQFYTRNHAAS